ncbi:hypothetical protein J5N97_003445 [Dioscorea zingiberensis]|uniref:Photolyase/cryptochrome alpha/beta domain-containing protein n=1 Tax=Dioscorea zingiberensis TaxID=325984 RepID=A0A9D5D5V5_9LILI|nr:hypothetical protein J5N97_003445 [Dioscorea zingiberensis]
MCHELLCCFQGNDYDHARRDGLEDNRSWDFKTSRASSRSPPSEAWEVLSTRYPLSSPASLALASTGSGSSWKASSISIPASRSSATTSLSLGRHGPVYSWILKDWNIGTLCFEFDIEPYSQARDNQVKDFASIFGIRVFSPISHALFNPADIIEKIAPDFRHAQTLKKGVEDRITKEIF